MLVDLDESIRHLLVERGNLDPQEIDISFEMPTRDWAAGISKPTVSLYMYDLRENLELRNPVPWNVRPGPNHTAIKSRPEVRLDVTYRVSAFASAVEDEHRILERIILVFLQNPVLPPEVLEGEIVGQEIKSSVSHSEGVFQNPSDFWGVIDNNLRPSIDCRVTANLDLHQEITTGLVLSSQILLGRLAESRDTSEGQNGSYRIGGRVVRQEDPSQVIPSARVTIPQLGIETATDFEGRFRFGGVPGGSYSMVVTTTDSAEHRQDIEVPGPGYDIGLP